MSLVFLSMSASAETSSELTQIEVGEMVFDARVSGPPDGQLVILLHGFPQTSYSFRRQLASLGAAGFRAVAPDQRGYSAGARPSSVGDYAMGALVSDVVGIADTLGRERFHLVGHDWGGAVAWVTALLHPDRLISLSVVSTPHVGALAAARANPASDQGSRSAYFSDFAAEDAEHRFLADDAKKLRALYDPSVFDASEIQTYLDVLGEPDALKGALNWYRALVSSRASAPSTAAPRPITVPTLYVWGDADPVFGRDAAEATASFVTGPYRFMALEGVGHWVLEQSAEALEPVLREHLETRRVAESRTLETLTLSAPLPSNGRIGGVTVDAHGTLYVANFSNTVWKVSPQGQAEIFTQGFQGSSGNDVDRDGNLLQASFLDGRLVRITPQGEQTTLTDGLLGPVGVLAESDGNIYICNCRGASIGRLDPAGELSTFAQSEWFQCPNGITRAPDGNLYVVNNGNGHLVRITPEGEASLLATLPGENNSHIVFAQESFFVTQVASNRVYRVFLDGRYEPFAGTGEDGLEDGPLSTASLSRPNGIAVSNDGSLLYINNVEGKWRGDEETRIVLRMIQLVEP